MQQVVVPEIHERPQTASSVMALKMDPLDLSGPANNEMVVRILEAAKQSANSGKMVVWKDFYKKYKTIDKTDDEFIETISFRINRENSKFNFEKVSKRTNLDIATVNTAIQIILNGDLIREAHLSAGGVGPIPLYLKKTGAFLQGKSLNPETVIEAIEVAGSEISPISDARGSKEYKRLLLRQLIFAHFIELFPERFAIEKLV